MEEFWIKPTPPSTSFYQTGLFRNRPRHVGCTHINTPLMTPTWCFLDPRKKDPFAQVDKFPKSFWGHISLSCKNPQKNWGWGVIYGGRGVGLGSSEHSTHSLILDLCKPSKWWVAPNQSPIAIVILICTLWQELFFVKLNSFKHNGNQHRPFKEVLEKHFGAFLQN